MFVTTFCLFAIFLFFNCELTQFSELIKGKGALVSDSNSCPLSATLHWQSSLLKIPVRFAL